VPWIDAVVAWAKLRTTRRTAQTVRNVPRTAEERRYLI
jgi:hypothetical protein